MSAETQVQPQLGSPPSQWPPLAHIVRKGEPVREGTVALCGARLMGLDLGHLDSATNRCEKCEAEMRRLLRS